MHQAYTAGISGLLKTFCQIVHIRLLPPPCSVFKTVQLIHVFVSSAKKRGKKNRGKVFFCLLGTSEQENIHILMLFKLG